MWTLFRRAQGDAVLVIFKAVGYPKVCEYRSSTEHKCITLFGVFVLDGNLLQMQEGNSVCKAPETLFESLFPRKIPGIQGLYQVFA